jgi:hypothetical protein
MQVNSNFISQNQQMWQTRHKSVVEMITDVQAGNISGAQQALGQIQQADQVLGITEGGSSSDASSGNSSSPLSVRNRVDLSSLMSAVQSGDLTSAQTAWQKVQASSASSGYQVQDSDGDQDNGGMEKDLTSLLTAVSSGDASGMQSAAAAVSNDLQSLLGTQQATSVPASTQAAASSSPNDPTKTLMDDLNSLLTAAQKGDSTSAQAAVQKLAQDLQGSAPVGSPGQSPQVEGHHHHHHHAAGGGSAGQATAAATTPASVLLGSAAETASADATGETPTA